MEEPIEKEPVSKEPTAEDVARARLEAPLTKSEKATFEARIAELIAENEALKAEIVELRETYDFTPKNQPAKKTRLNIPTLFDE